MSRTTANAGAIRIVRVHRVYANSFGALFDDEVAFPSGARGRYVRWRWTAKRSVAVLPLVGVDECVLVQVYRHAARRWVLEVPKGLASTGSRAREDASRELREELGLAAKRWSALGELWADPGFVGSPVACFIAHDCVEVAAPTPEATESFGPQRRMPLDEAYVQSNDVLTRMLVAHALLRRSARPSMHAKE